VRRAGGVTVDEILQMRAGEPVLLEREMLVGAQVVAGGLVSI
jgi:hypothetical protein